MIKGLFTDLTPFILLSLKGEEEGIIFEGAKPLQSTLNEQFELKRESYD